MKKKKWFLNIMHLQNKKKNNLPPGILPPACFPYKYSKNYWTNHAVINRYQLPTYSSVPFGNYIFCKLDLVTSIPGTEKIIDSISRNHGKHTPWLNVTTPSH